MRLPNFFVGRQAERTAARLLRRRGLLILARNVRRAGGEIDLLALDHGVLVVVEVKQRAAGILAADLAIDRRKEARLLRTLHAFLRERRVPRDTPVRFDTVLLSDGVPPVHRRGSLHAD